MKSNGRFYHWLIWLGISLMACQQATQSPTPAATPFPSPSATETPFAVEENTAVPSPEAGSSADQMPYQDATLPTAERVADLLSRMSLAEKIGQMTLVEKSSVGGRDITNQFIGALLSGGGSGPSINTPEAWLEMVTGYQAQALATPLGIPLLYGVDAVHGHNNVRGATIFPHNIGLGATRNPALVEEIGRLTAVEVTATGIHWNYAPVLAVARDIRWGRTYESYSEDSDLVSLLGTAYVRGLQGESLSHPQTVLATPKHFVADGGTVWGTSTSRDYLLDQGDTQVDEAVLRAVHLPPYQAVIEAGAVNMMVSFSSWNGTKMHGHAYLLTDVLKTELGFDGFLVSDWEGINQIYPGNYYQSVVTAVNAGVDMNMVPYEYQLFIDTLTQAVDNGDVSLARIDDAVSRILAVKFALGLFEHPIPDGADLDLVGSAAHREVAREAVRQSLVLLKNDHQALPLAPETPLIFVVGTAADDIGIQSGGWTIEWQGAPGDITPGTTILQAIETAVSPETTVHFSRSGNFAHVRETADVSIVVIGEMPYAEGVGDAADLTLADSDITLLERVRSQSDQVVVILLSGRPLIITEQLPLADAWIAAWLPGTEGQGVADLLFGQVDFTGKLPFSWPRSMAQLPFDLAHLPAEGCDAPLFPFGYGLDTTTTQEMVILEC